VLAEARYLAHAQPAGLMRALQQQGASLTLLDPSQTLLDVADAGWLAGIDVVVARGRSTDLLARLAIAEAAGVPTLNSRGAISAVLDKAHMGTQLQAAGLPVPATWIGSTDQVRRNVPADAFPLVLKPVFGDNCRGIQVVHTPAQLQAVTWSEPTVIAQALVPNAGFDTKLYAIGEQVWAVRKPSPLRGGGPATLLPLPPAWRELALRCGAVFGLQLFGVDCIERQGELKVIEVNDFPNYTGVPEADALLARHIDSASRQGEGTTP
jgi:ribosomal protein S6--L-glutamate ligase